MSGARIESAVERIESALARIAKVADGARPEGPAISALVERHERLREVAGNTLLQLDDLIAELDE